MGHSGPFVSNARGVPAFPPPAGSPSRRARHRELKLKLATLQKDYADLHTALFEAAQVHRHLCAPRRVEYGDFEIASEVFAVRYLPGDFFAVEEAQRRPDPRPGRRLRERAGSRDVDPVSGGAGARARHRHIRAAGDREWRESRVLPDARAAEQLVRGAPRSGRRHAGLLQRRTSSRTAPARGRSAGTALGRRHAARHGCRRRLQQRACRHSPPATSWWPTPTAWSNRATRQTRSSGRNAWRRNCAWHETVLPTPCCFQSWPPCRISPLPVRWPTTRRSPSYVTPSLARPEARRGRSPPV